MAIFGLKVTNDIIESKFFMDLSMRMKDGNFIKNPFTGGVRSLNDSIYLVSMTPIWINIAPLALLIGMVSFLLWGWTNWLIVFIAITLSGVLWTPYFYYFMFILGLKKQGYKHKILYVSTDELMEKIYFKGE